MIKPTCERIEESDQPGHTPSLIRDFGMRFVSTYIRTQTFFGRRAKTLIRLADSQADLSPLGAHIILWGLSCSGSIRQTRNFIKWAASWQNQQSDCAPSEDSDQPGHPPSLIRVFAVRTKKACVLSYPLSAQWRRCSDWADAQADLSLRWALMPFCWFCHEVSQMASTLKRRPWIIHCTRFQWKVFNAVLDLISEHALLFCTQWDKNHPILLDICLQIVYEPLHDKTNEMACAPIEDWASAQYDQNLRCRHEKIFGP